MKALIICPTERRYTQLLAEKMPLAIFPCFGKPFVFYSIEHLVGKGASHIMILAADRPEEVRHAVGDGSRWGVQVEVIPEQRELSIREARKKYRAGDDASWLPEPDDAITADRWPSQRECDIFSSYANLFAALKKTEVHKDADRIGLRELQPGVWVGDRARISSTAKLNAPCWIGNHVTIGAHAVVGPNAIIEDQCMIEAHSEITSSIITPHTFVGKYTNIANSIALGNVLVNWRTNSHAIVADSFLLSALNDHEPVCRTTSVLGRLIAAAIIVATAPAALLWALQSWLRTQTFVQERLAVAPGEPGGNIRYFEFTNSTGLWRRWPQLFNVMRGEFAWIGNRPLTATQAATLTNEFEKLWLLAPVGLFSQADISGCCDSFCDESRAHASYYAARQNWRLDLSILWNILKNFGQIRSPKPIALPGNRIRPQTLPVQDTVVR